MAQNRPLFNAYPTPCVHSAVISEGLVNSFLKSYALPEGSRDCGGGTGEIRLALGFALQTGSLQPVPELSLERSLWTDKIKAFPLPNHYLIFEAITKLIVSISQVSSCSFLTLAFGALAKGLPNP